MFTVKGFACLILFAFAFAASACGQPPPGAPDSAQPKPAGPPDGAQPKPDGPPGFGPPPFGMPPFPLKDALDTDGDGKLSAAELRAAPAALKKLDKNKDGKLDAEEIGWPPRFPGMPGGPGGFGPPGGGQGFPFGGNARSFAQRLMARDVDGDGHVTKDELPKSMHFLIQRGDRNHDGALDAQEAQQLAQKLGLEAANAPPARPDGKSG